MTRDGKGWHEFPDQSGKAPKHKDAAERAKAGEANNTPMVKTNPDDRLDSLREELKQKYGDYIWSAQKRLQIARHLLNNMEFYSIMDTDTLSNDTIQFQAQGLESAYDFKESFRRYFERKLIPKDMNVYTFLDKEAVLDEEWNKRRNKDYKSEVFLKYNYKEPLINKIKQILNNEIIPDLEGLLIAEQEKEEYLKNLQAGKKKFDFSYYESWETGIQFLRIEGGVDKQTFSKLQREAGLEYHQPDEEMEERFKGWATRDIEKAWEILIEAGYYRPPRS